MPYSRLQRIKTINHLLLNLFDLCHYIYSFWQLFPIRSCISILITFIVIKVRKKIWLLKSCMKQHSPGESD